MKTVVSGDFNQPFELLGFYENLEPQHHAFRFWSLRAAAEEFLSVRDSNIPAVLTFRREYDSERLTA